MGAEAASEIDGEVSAEGAYMAQADAADDAASIGRTSTYHCEGG